MTTINATVGEQWANPAYDANGNMTAIPRPGLNRPSWANLTTDQWSTLTVDDWSRMEVAPTFTATYDAWNRLVKLSEPPASAGGGWTPVQENQYDGRGYRIVVRNYSSGLPSPDSHLYYTDQWQCVEERLGTSTTPDRQFIWGVRYIDDLILRDRSVSGGTLGQPPAADERLYALQDANWNVTAVVNPTGDVQERYEYDPYGVTTVLAPDFTVRSASNFAWETTYCGYRWDQASGLFLARFRFYHPALGSWLTRDPSGYSTSLGLYDYPDPLRLFDPLGLGFWSAVGSFVGAAVQAAAIAATVTVTIGAVGVVSPFVAGALTVIAVAATVHFVAQSVTNMVTGEHHDILFNPTGQEMTVDDYAEHLGSLAGGYAGGRLGRRATRLGYDALAERARCRADAAAQQAAQSQMESLAQQQSAGELSNNQARSMGSQRTGGAAEILGNETWTGQSRGGSPTSGPLDTCVPEGPPPQPYPWTNCGEAAAFEAGQNAGVPNWNLASSTGGYSNGNCGFKPNCGNCRGWIPRANPWLDPNYLPNRTPLPWVPQNGVPVPGLPSNGGQDDNF